MEVWARMIESLEASDIQKSAEIEKLKLKLRESERKARHSSEEVSRGLQERDHALVQVKAERQATRHAKDQLEEEQLARTKLQEEYARHEVSLVEAQSHNAYLESETHQSKVVKEYRHGIFGKAEVVIACKAGFDYLKAQLPAEMKSISDRFHYLPRVANCLDILLDIEKQGEGLDLGRRDAGDEESDDEESDDEADEDPHEKAEEGGKGLTREAGEGSGKDSRVSSSGKKKDHGTEPEVQSTPSLPAAGGSLPLTPGAGMDLS